MQTAPTTPGQLQRLSYMESDIPPEMTIADYRAQNAPGGRRTPLRRRLALALRR